MERDGFQRLISHSSKSCAPQTSLPSSVTECPTIKAAPREVVCAHTLTHTRTIATIFNHGSARLVVNHPEDTRFFLVEEAAEEGLRLGKCSFRKRTSTGAYIPPWQPPPDICHLGLLSSCIGSSRIHSFEPTRLLTSSHLAVSRAY